MSPTVSASPYPTGESCSNDSDCPSGSFCVGGVCTTVTCPADTTTCVGDIGVIVTWTPAYPTCTPNYTYFYCGGSPSPSPSGGGGPTLMPTSTATSSPLTWCDINGDGATDCGACTSWDADGNCTSGVGQVGTPPCTSSCNDVGCGGESTCCWLLSDDECQNGTCGPPETCETRYSTSLDCYYERCVNTATPTPWLPCQGECCGSCVGDTAEGGCTDISLTCCTACAQTTPSPSPTPVPSETNGITPSP